MIKSTNMFGLKNKDIKDFEETTRILEVEKKRAVFQQWLDIEKRNLQDGLEKLRKAEDEFKYHSETWLLKEISKRKWKVIIND